MSKRKDVSTLISAAGWVSSLIGELVSALKERGVTDEQIHSFVTNRGKIPFSKIADEVAKEIRAKTLLKLIPADKFISTDEGLMPNDTKNLFFCDNPNFTSWKTDKEQSITGGASLAVYDIVRGGTFTELFGSLSDDVDKLCLTFSQIEDFVKQHRNLFMDRYGIFFLFISYGRFFVADVIPLVPFTLAGISMIPMNELCVRVERFEYHSIWNDEHHHRLVTPQLA